MLTIRYWEGSNLFHPTFALFLSLAPIFLLLVVFFFFLFFFFF